MTARGPPTFDDGVTDTAGARGVLGQLPRQDAYARTPQCTFLSQYDAQPRWANRALEGGRAPQELGSATPHSLEQPTHRGATSTRRVNNPTGGWQEPPTSGRAAMGASSPGRVFDLELRGHDAYTAMDERRASRFLRSYQTVAGPHHYPLCRFQVRRFG
jgi:hypothetical protein